MRPRLVVAALVLGITTAAPAADEGSAHVVVGSGSTGAMPAWSPDGTHIVFHSRRKGKDGSATRNIMSVRNDGSGEVQLTKGTKDAYHASLSPDGKKLVFVSELNGSRDIWIADADGQNAVPLTDDPGTEDQPAWAPDSHQIVYAAFPKEGGSFDLWLVNTDGSGRRRLTTTPANEIFPAWHPSGETIAYVTDSGGNFDIYTITVRDGRTTPLVVSPDQEARPAWAPDGSKLAFARWPARGRSTDATLWVANIDGTAPIELTTAPAPAMHPAWAPDGRTLAFQHRESAGWEIWTLALPSDIAETGRLRLAQQVRGGADVDTAKLTDGDTIRGTLRETQLPMRTAYGALELPRSAVSSILFGSSERGLARISLVNGDTVTGFLETEEFHMDASGRTETIAVARLAQLSLRRAAASIGTGEFRALMRNGDSLMVSTLTSPLTLRVGGHPTEVSPAQLERLECAEGGGKTQVVLRSGDSLSGDLVNERLDFVLGVGPHLTVHASMLRTLSRVGAPPPVRAGGGTRG
jgi:dipeptidyl aminopeptidase/acylaminoacyl peptidase